MLDVKHHTPPVELAAGGHPEGTDAATLEPDYRLKLIFVWLLILPFLAILYSISRNAEPLSLQLLPEVPRQNEPTVLTAKMSNENADTNQMTYTVHVDGKLLAEGTSQVAPQTEALFQYFRGPTVDIGQRVNFAVDIHTAGSSLQQVVSSPAYAPQIWSSFVSFATFSTSVMSSLVTAVYYQGAFGTATAPNLGLILVGTLTLLMVFLEMSRPQGLESTEPVQEHRAALTGRLARLQSRYWQVVVILTIIFGGIIFTKVAIVLSLAPGL